MALILVAVGGNALIRTGQIGSAAEQLENARQVESAVEFVERTGRDAVISVLGSLALAADGRAGTRVVAARREG